MHKNYKLIVDTYGRYRFRFDEPIKDHTFIQSLGNAQLFFIAFTLNELSNIIDMCLTLKLPFFLFGTGSKIIITNQVLNCLVIKNRTKKIEVKSVKGKVSKSGIGVEEALIEVESGVSIGKFTEFIANQGLRSIDSLNIPGSIGGNLLINSTLQNMVKSIKILDQNSRILEIATKDLNLKKHIILSAIFQVKAK
jgi:UDP-N-acetylmuramate dehydrogenase